MAAQKLTRGRFVQIIIMLTLLLAAFFWRTVNHDFAENISCRLGNECVFHIEKSQFIASLSEGSISIISEDDSWEIDALSSHSSIERNGHSWIIYFPETQKEMMVKFTSNAGESKTFNFSK
ncbi:hypothetical protein [Vibrio japonicus]|uniref:Uncharacterized protein n=1 Tax=Vibrio japonicus TaxID=1824638 RepID=A0ABY5LIK7_9VIBR|nr:hypothetical protein [Vibrio japonicus]UUM31888.1 hypothetical protein NP165_06545 [Vibrio japonicus]